MAMSVPTQAIDVVDIDGVQRCFVGDGESGSLACARFLFCFAFNSFKKRRAVKIETESE